MNNKREKMKKYQKYLLSLGVLTTITAPVASIIILGSKDPKDKNIIGPDPKIDPNLNFELEKNYQTTLQNKTTLNYQIGQNLTVKQLAIEIDQNKINKNQIKFQIEAIDDKKGQIEVLAIDFVTGKKIVNYSILIIGFKKATIEEILANDLKQIKSKYETNLKSKTLDQLNLKVDQEINEAQIGIIFPKNALRTKPQLVVKKIEPTQGVVELEIKFTKEKRNDHKIIKVEGFKVVEKQTKTLQENVEDYFKQNLKKTYESTNKELDLFGPDWRYKDLKIDYIFEKFKEDLNKLYGVELNFKGEVKATDTYNGQVTVSFEVKDNENTTIYQSTFIVDRFFTVYKTYLEKEVKNIYTTTNPNSSIDDLKLKVGQEVSPETLGIELPQPTPWALTVKLKIENIQVDKVIVNMTISRNKFSKSKTIEINGFKTQEQENKKLVDQYLKKLRRWYETIHNDKTPIELRLRLGAIVDPKTLGIESELPPNDDGLTIQFVVMSPFGYSDSSIEVRISLIKGEYFDHHFITISGFKTQEQKDQEDKKLVNKYLNDIEDNLLTNKTNKTPRELGLEKGKSTDPNILGIDLPPNDDGLTIEFTIKDIDVETGEVKIEIKVSKGTYSKSTITTISGFKIKN